MATTREHELGMCTAERGLLPDNGTTMMLAALLTFMACTPEEEPEPVGEWRCVKELTPLVELDLPPEGFDRSPRDLLAESTGMFSGDADVSLLLPEQGVQLVDFSPELVGGVEPGEAPVCLDDLFVFASVLWTTNEMRMDADAGLTVSASGAASFTASVRTAGGESRGAVDIGDRAPTAFSADDVDTIDVVLHGEWVDGAWSLELSWEGTRGEQVETERIWLGESTRPSE